MYRGQDIGDLQQLESKCLSILQEGSVEALYDILPHLSVIRSRSFRFPVEKLLESSNRDKKQFAVIALGILGGESSLSHLSRLAGKIRAWQGPGIRSLERTLIAALGESGSSESIPPLLEIFHYQRQRDKFAAERRLAVITALAFLVQHGVDQAQEKLLEMLRYHSAEVRAQAAMELGFAFWHRADQVPEKVLKALSVCLKDQVETVQRAARISLEDFATLGNSRARDFADS